MPKKKISKSVPMSCFANAEYISSHNAVRNLELYACRVHIALIAFYFKVINEKLCLSTFI